MGPGVKRWRTSMLPKNIQPGTLGQKVIMKKRKKKEVTWKDLTKYLKKHNISGSDAIILLKAEAIKDNFKAINMRKQIKKLQASSSKLQA